MISKLVFIGFIVAIMVAMLGIVAPAMEGSDFIYLCVGLFVVNIFVFVFWRLLAGVWFPDGSFVRRHSPSGFDWKKIGEEVDSRRRL